MAISSPVIISVSIGAVLVLSVALVTIVRWASRKPSTQLPPPRSGALLSPYWANQQRYSTHFGPDVYDEERKLTGKGSGVFNPYAEYTSSNVSDTSLYRGSKTPDGDRTPNSGASFGHENVGTQSEHLPTPPVQPNELGEISLNSPNPPRQRPTSLQFVNGSPASRPPAGNFGPNGSSLATVVGGGAQQAAATDPQSGPQNAPPSAFSHMHPSPPRPFSTSSRSRHSIAGPPPNAIAQPPPSFYQTKQDRRASRMSMLSTYSSSGYTYDPRRSSVTSMIRGPPHKSNMQIVLPAPLAPTAASSASASAPGIGFPGNNIGSAHDAEDSAFRRNQRRHSRVDLWTETNNIARSKSPLVPLADLSAASNRRPSLGSEKSGRSLELANSGQFMHMPPPPPLPASSRSLLTSSTPNSSSSALPPPMSSAMTTPQRSTGSSEIVHEKHASSSDAHSTSTLSNAVVVDDSKPSQPQNEVKSDNLPTIPSLPPIEPTKDI